MPNYMRSKGSAFPELTSVSDARWAALCGLLAVAFRPPNRWSDSFAEHGLTPLSGLTMFTMRWQPTKYAHARKPQRSVILQAVKFGFDVRKAQLYVDPRRNDECSAAVFDCAIPRSEWGVCRHHLDPSSNKTAADLAIAMSREANRALEQRESIPHQPTLPEFYLAFSQRPVVERGVVLRREASSAFDKSPDAVTDAELDEYFWATSFESGSYICLPQRYFARQGEYLVHPVDGSVRPEGDGSPDQWQGLWYFGDGRWNAGAQRPDHVYAHMGNVLGRSFRNPAFTVLKANDFFPAKLFPDGLDYPQFMAAPDIDGLHQRIVDALEANSTVGDMLVASMRQELGRTSDMATDDDLRQALDRPDRPLNLSFATGVRMVRISETSQRAMTWHVPGGYVELFSTKRIWASRVEPAEVQPIGSGHGRSFASPAK